jgi:HAD superfamily hydrolase (TIGR01509 family)
MTVVGAVLIFDFDGTVLDTEWPAYRSWAEIWEDHGHELTISDWSRRIGTHHELDALADLEARVGRRLDPDLRDRRNARKDELTVIAPLNPGVLEWLDEADQLGVPVGIASSSPSSWVERNLARLGLRDRFGCLACCDGALPAKPDPTSYRHAVQQLGGDPAVSVAVEDSEHGVNAAAAAGLFTIAVPHGLTAHMDLSKADIVLASLDELTLADGLDQARRRATS